MLANIHLRVRTCVTRRPVGLENRRLLTGLVSSNLTLSAKYFHRTYARNARASRCKKWRRSEATAPGEGARRATCWARGGRRRPSMAALGWLVRCGGAAERMRQATEANR